jgi:ATP-dependent DNA helicase PIF1
MVETSSSPMKNLPLELKIEILLLLDYEDVMFVTCRRFWSRYWSDYNRRSRPKSILWSRGDFVPNPEQAYVLRLIRAKKNIFINAPAGTGKSTLVKHLKRMCPTESIGITSTTGISALNISGSTLHSYLGIGLGVEDVDDLYRGIVTKKNKHDLWLNLSILVIDEISMLHPTLFDKLEKLARMIRGNDSPFGGIQLVVTGDLFQLPCVSDDSSLIISSKVFKRCMDTTVELRNIMRQSDPTFIEILNKIRVGAVDEQVRSALESRFTRSSGALPGNNNILPTRLYCTRDSVAKLNEKELDKLAAKGHEFKEYSMEFVGNGQLANTLFNYVKKNFIKNSTTPDSLCLCLGTQVMLTYNTSPGLVNGSRGVVKGFTDDEYPVVEFVNGLVSDIRPVKFSLFNFAYGKASNVGHAIQVPLKVAYALTIHSCQGSTLDYAYIDLRRTFEYGQAYTALSRVKSLDGLFMKKFDLNVIQAHPEALEYIS